MDVVIIFNGLGNQMSQYAFFLAKKVSSPKCIAVFDSDSDYNHNGFELVKLFGLTFPGKGLTRIFLFLYHSLQKGHRRFLLRLLGVKQFNEPANYDFTAQMLLPGPRGINFYRGGWHSESYFKSMEKELNQVFRFPEDKDNAYISWKNMILSAGDSVSIHVRRGDYVNISPDDFYQFGDVATADYYKCAVEYMKCRFRGCVFFVFSDDILWCRENFGDDGFFYVEGNRGINAWRDMSLMTMCHHHINANSTFSWWGAWLNDAPNSVVIRPKWFIRDVETKDFYPDKWIVLE